MKKLSSDITKKIILAGLIAILPLTASACSKQAKASSGPEPGKEQASSSVDAFGVVKANTVKNILIDFPATVEKINVKEGQAVRKGDLLVSLNIEEYMSQITKKELELSAEKNELNRLSKNYIGNSGSPELKKLQNDLHNAQDLFQQGLKELDSKKALFQAGSISQQELEDFEKTVEQKEKSINDIMYSIDTIKYDKNTEGSQKETQASIMDADLKVMKNRLAKSYISGSTIVSDVNRGIVYEMDYNAGDILKTDKKLLSILDMDSLVVKADVDEEFIKDVKDGASAVIVPTADKSKEYRGKVTFISDKAIQKNNETLVPVEISIENPDDFLLPEFNVDVRIEMQK